MLEYVFKLGSLAGLVSAGFLIFDRFFAHRPTLSLHRVVEHYAPEVYLRIVNNHDSDLIIHSIECSPDRWTIAEDDETKAIATAVLRRKLTDHVIPPKGTHLLLIIRISDGTTPKASEALTFIVSWNLSGEAWRWSRKSKLKTHTDRIDQMIRSGPIKHP
ncbi:hypothetical protein AB4099_22070 [Bosea sp. 2KB_26]|uniref:hypothetical protein n=1 Tax=Bosea sp. 2KB_26 TaxID=3237475 RepID=UPI003F932D6B